MKKKDELRELRELSGEKLQQELLTVSRELMKLRFRHGSGQLSETHLLNRSRTRLARVRTVLKESSVAV